MVYNRSKLGLKFDKNKNVAFSCVNSLFLPNIQCEFTWTFPDFE